MRISLPAMHPYPTQDDGRIPLRIRIGVTGHRSLGCDEQTLSGAVREQVRRVIGLFGDRESTACLSVVSQLADGADRIVVREVFEEAREHDLGARLEAFLPFRRQEYVEAQRFGADSLAEFDELLEIATVKREPVGAHAATEKSRAAAYGAAGRQLVARCDVLIALWDGRPPDGRGGTAETLIYAAARSKPCIWISTEGDPTVSDNFSPGEGESFFSDIAERARLSPPIQWSPMDHPREVLEPLSGAFAYLDEFNRESLPRSYGAVLREESSSPRGLAPWVAAPFARANTLAARWRWRFQWTARLITLMATVAAVMLAIGLSYGKESAGWAWAEAGFFALALIGLLFVRKIGFHRRWLSYRVLAERLRSAHFLAPTGADFRRQARLEAVYAGSEPTSWLMRAFEEIWDRRPPHPPPVRDLTESQQEELRRRLAEDWVGQQIHYHDSAVRHHRRWHLILVGSASGLFLATIVFACLHSLHMAEDAAVFFSVALPAAGASLGVLLTVNQHQALSERSARMRSDLAVVRRNVLDATPDSLESASSEAARTIAQETGAWFGSMWFLDIEHP